jgi:hypothetical protein
MAVVFPWNICRLLAGNVSDRSPVVEKLGGEPMNNTCARCGKTGEHIGWFADLYRKKEIRNNRPDPGNLCGACAGSDTGRRIAAEINSKDKP